MNMRLTLVFVLGIHCAPNANAMPIVAISPAQTRLTIPVSSGCGIGVHRGPFDGCDPVYVYDGYYWAYSRGYRLGYYRGYRRGYYRGYYDADYRYVR